MVADPADPLAGVRGSRSTPLAVVRMEGRKVEKGLRLCEGISESRPGATAQARDLLSTASYLNFLHWVAPGGFCRQRSGRHAVNESRATELWGPR